MKEYHSYYIWHNKRYINDKEKEINIKILKHISTLEYENKLNQIVK